MMTITTDVKSPADPIEEIATLLSADEQRSAWAAMVRVLGQNPTSATCQAIAGLAANLDPKRAELVTLRVALLANFTMDALSPILIARGLSSRLLVQPFVAEYDTWVQELLDANSNLDRFAPDVVVLALRLETLSPALTRQFLELTPAGVAREIEEVAERIGEVVRVFRERAKAKVLLHSFPIPVDRALGVIDAGHSHGQTAAIRLLNEKVMTLAAKLQDVYVVDTDGLVSQVGWSRWNDTRMYAVAKMPLSAAALHAIAEIHLRYLRAFAGLVRKVLVVDLDNTLWGGIVGEDGVDGIQLGQTYPGTAYADLQRAILQLHLRGVVLAINSHNNEEDVTEVLERHPNMVLQPQHFAATRINWQDKAANMLEIAEELGLGIESFVFLDDSLAQCERMRQALPEVLTIHQAGDLSGRVTLLDGLGVFDSLGFTDEDRARGGFYRTEAQRTRLKRTVQSVDDYLRSLEMELRIEPITTRNVGRVSDLTQRTNQFNFTTPRHTVDSLSAFLSHPGNEGYAFRLSDRFGDSGLIAAALLGVRGNVAVIDAFLMSCRVLKRTVEDAILAFLCHRVANLGAARLRGLYRPTRKNIQVAEFYPSHGFEECGRHPDATIVFERAIAEAAVTPEWITVIGPD